MRGTIPLTEAQRSLVESHVEWARALSRSLAVEWNASGDDLAREALLALVDTASRFDPARGFAFATLARIRVQGACLDYRRVLARQHHRFLDNRDHPDDRPDESSTLTDQSYADATVAAHALLSYLSQPVRQIVEDVVFEGLNFVEAAAKRHVSDCTAGRRYRSGIATLSAVLAPQRGNLW